MTLRLTQRIRCMVDTPGDLAVVTESGGALQFTTPQLPAGLYRVSALIDASDFDWEQLYIPMHRYANSGQRTGPWDFDFDGFKPLVPAWWAIVNGEKLGLVVVARPSPAQVRSRTMTLAWCFELASKSPAHVRLEPYNPSRVSAMEMVIEPEPFDRIKPVSIQSLDRASPAAHQVCSGILAELARAWTSASPEIRLLASKAIQWAREHPDCSETLPLLALAHRELQDAQAGEIIASQVARWISLEHWGNPVEAGYGHDCDMGVAAIIEPLSILYHWSGPLLESLNLRTLLREKLDLQMNRFYTKMLLASEYWGGSLMQDHGHRSVSRFGVAAMNMLGILPSAQHWTEFVIQRMDRVLELLPDDGSIPFSSYIKIHLYMDDMTSYRDALLHVTGRDLFKNSLFPSMIRFVANRLDEKSAQVMCVSSRGDRKDFYAGWGFFNVIAKLHHDPAAARLSQILVDLYQSRPMQMRPAATFLQAMMHRDFSIVAGPPNPMEFDHRPDTGLVDYRPRGHEVNVSMRCVIPGSAHSGSRLICPCDRVKDAPLEGHFSVSVSGQALLQTAEGGYRMRSSLGSVLLVDGRGGFGDDDFAMGIPGLTDRGERIIAAWHHASTGKAFVRMQLAPAYPREMQLLHYTREFHLYRHGMTVRDHVVAREAHQYSWCFHTYARRTLEQIAQQQANTLWRISEGDSALTLSVGCMDQPLETSIAPTQIVWGYGNENDSQPFKHLKISTTRAATQLTAEFEIAWSGERFPSGRNT